MEDLIYILDSNDGYSGEYYNNVKLASKVIEERINIWAEGSIDDFMHFIIENKIEKVRSKKEYSIELMFIGVMFQEYVNNARVLKNIPIAPIVFINNFKSKKEEEWKFIGEIKGRIANKMLFKNIDEGDEYHFDDFISIIKWLKATTCFKEEVLRLENWKEFFKIKSERYVKKVIELAIDISLDLNDIGKKYLEDYVNSLQKTSLENLDLNNDKEKYICIPKGRIQYFFNIISAEIINQIYRERYLKASEKVLIASSSMRDNKKNCCSLKTNNGFKCKNCSNDCYVSKLGVLGEEMGVRIYSVESDSPIFEIREKCKTETAIIAATSGLKLMSIGWKIVRTGYIPQCVLLENCKNSVLKTKRNVMKYIDIYKISS